MSCEFPVHCVRIFVGMCW